MKKKYIVRLSEEERKQLEELIRKGKTKAYRILHANLLLSIDAEGLKWSDSQAAEAFRCHLYTVRNVRKRFVEQGLEAAIDHKKPEKPRRAPILDGEKEARLVTIACSEPPDGRSRWTLELLAGKLVELKIVDSISGQTVRRRLKKIS